MRWAFLFLFAACGGGSSAAPDGGQPIDAGSETRAPMDAGCFASAPTGPLEVAIEQGTVRGMFDGDARVFLGIPYAAPPKRWMPADPPNCFHALFQANAFGEECTQIDRSGNVAGSEDCLTLNVWAPKTPGPHAVMVWIHGGDNIIGSAQDYFSDVPVYDGKALAEREDVIVVTIQYRLGAFGFLQHASFADARGIIGNFGTLDQITALGWVKRNIAAFGGDPAKVTIFGQSAGGDAVCALLASPMSAGLFSGAILHSGACYINSPDVTQASAKAVMSKLGCTQGDVAACMRSKPVDAIAKAPGGGLGNETTAKHYISIDGKVLPKDPIEIFKAGAHNKVPAIAMVTRDEYLSLVDLVVTKPLASQSDFEAYVNQVFDAKTAAFVIQNYPTAKYPTPAHAFCAALSDQTYHCRVRRNLRAIGSASPTWRAIFMSAYVDPRIAKYGAGHGFDIPYVFDTFGSLQLTQGQRDLSKSMMHAWATFAKTGDAGWTAYDPKLDDYMAFDETSGMQSGWHSAICDAWDSL